MQNAIAHFSSFLASYAERKWSQNKIDIMYICKRFLWPHTERWIPHTFNHWIRRWNWMKNHSMKKGFDQAKFVPCLFHRTVQFPKRFCVLATGYSHSYDKRIRAFAFHTFGSTDYSGNRQLLLHRIDLKFISICRTRHFILTMIVWLFSHLQLLFLFRLHHANSVMGRFGRKQVRCFWST